MMSLRPLRAHDAAHYYKKDNYYLKDQEDVVSEWVGRGAERLALEGAVDHDTFAQLVRGEVGDTVLGRGSGDQRQHRPGWDMTFSAPKSVSIAALVYGDDRLLEAHRQAVRAALDYVEREAVQARVTDSGQTRRINTGELLSASFRHTTSRELDPQLHTHAVVVNATWAKERWRAVASERLFQLQRDKVVGQIYRTELAHQARRLGYSLRSRGEGQFELADVPRAALSAFSRRREQILRYLEDKGLAPTAEATQQATLRTRKHKRSVAYDDVREAWRAQLGQLGLGADLASIQARGVDVPQPAEQRRQALLRRAVRLLTDREMSWTEDALLKQLSETAMGELSAGEAQNLIRSGLESGYLQQADANRYTTAFGKRLERELIGALDRGRDTVGVIGTPAAIEHHLKKTHLNAEQRNAVQTVLQSRDRYTGIQGFAGVGKTTLLSELSRFAGKRGYSVRTFAPTYAAVDELAKSVGAGEVLDKMLQRGRPEQPPAPHRPRQLWVVDESSFLSATKARRIMKLAEREKARVVFVGDTAQLEALDAGRPFALLQNNGLQTATVSAIQRQKDDTLRSSVEDYIAERPTQALRRLDEAGHIEQTPEGQSVRRMVDEWTELSAAERARTVMIVPTNAERLAVAERVRQALQQEGEIRGRVRETYNWSEYPMGGAEARDVNSYQPRMVVRFNQVTRLPDKQGRAEAHSYWTVIGKDPKHNRLLLRSEDATRRVWVDPGRVPRAGRGGLSTYARESTELARGDRLRWRDRLDEKGLRRNDELVVRRVGKRSMSARNERTGKTVKLRLNNPRHQHYEYHYASTAYAAQGQSHDRVLTALDPYHKNTVNQRSVYIALSRAKHQVRIFTDDKKGLYEAVGVRKPQKTDALRQEEQKAARRGARLI